MFKALLVLALALLLVKADVVDLTRENFDKEIAKTEFTLVEFYAPWCPHCKSLAPEYETLAKDMEEHKNIAIAKIDCDNVDNRDIAEKYDIQGFPTIKLFKNGQLFRDYDGERNAESIKKWLNKKTGPMAIPIKTLQDMEQLLASAKKEAISVLIGFFESVDSEKYKSFMSQVDHAALEDFAVGEVIGLDVEIASKYLKDIQEQVTLFRHFETEPLVSNFENIVNFTVSNGYPIIDELSGRSFKRFVEAKLPIAILFLDPETKDENDALLSELKPLAEELRGKILFGYSDGKLYAEQLSLMGGNAGVLPGLALMKLDTRQNYPFTGDVSKVDEVKKWAQGILDGSVKPFMRSQAIPVKNDEPVKVVVGKTFKEIVYDNSKDVLLEFYAPWCGHCKSLEPKYNKLAKTVAHVENLVIAKIDATENDTPLTIEGFPTIYFFPSNNKDEPILYDGYRTPRDMLKFLKKHAVASKDQLKPEIVKLEQKKEKTIETADKHDEL